MKSEKKKFDHEDYNWIEKVEKLSFSFFNNDDKKNDDSNGKIEEYNIGISGKSFDTGSLSQKMYEAITRNSSSSDDEMKLAYKIYALDYTAREVTRLACEQNGYEMEGADGNISEWGRIQEIQLIEPKKGRPIGETFESWDSFALKWKPGKAFNFVVHGIKAKQKELELNDIWESLDPDGKLRASGNLDLPTEEIESLKDLKYEVKRRTEAPPIEASTPDQVFVGTTNKGYNIISAKDLLASSTNEDGSENHKTMMHVMDALVSHSVLIVDLGDDNNEKVTKMTNMWKLSQKFFSILEADPTKEELLPKMQSIDPSVPSAKIGYANFEGGEMKFLETRLHRTEGTIMPTEVQSLVVDEDDKYNVNSILSDVFQVLADVGKNVIRIATAASSVENGGFDEYHDAEIKATQSATKMVEELVDDGTALDSAGETTSVSMSPHRLCCYNNLQKSKNEKESLVELFGAHTDSSFVTIVPVGAIAGLEVYDEAAKQWYRPELKAKNVWEEENNDNNNKYWHARYLAVMPGEFLQIATRNEINAAVHRVVASNVGKPRLSAPLLLRGRPGIRFSAEKYVGTVNTNLLKEVDGLYMQEIHNFMN